MLMVMFFYRQVSLTAVTRVRAVKRAWRAIATPNVFLIWKRPISVVNVNLALMEMERCA